MFCIFAGMTWNVLYIRGYDVTYAELENFVTLELHEIRPKYHKNLHKALSP